MVRGILVALAATAALWSAAGPTRAQDASRPAVDGGAEAVRSVLFVGNSFFYYNDSMHSVFLDFARRGEPGGRYRATSATISGSGLNWHDVDAYLRPGGGMGSYSFVGDNEVVFNEPGKVFDAVLMNDCSQCPVNPRLSGLFFEYVRKHADTARARGALPILFMTWAYADRPEMTRGLADAYVKAGNDNGLLVVPAGLAFAEALARKPDLVLYARDKRHPSPAGTYLGAATIYASLARRSPADLAVAMPGVDADTAALLRRVAWDTVQRFHGR